MYSVLRMHNSSAICTHTHSHKNRFATYDRSILNEISTIMLPTMVTKLRMAEMTIIRMISANFHCLSMWLRKEFASSQSVVEGAADTDDSFDCTPAGD